MDDEDGDFTITGSSRSRLSSLFQNENSSGDINQALMFTAPKQPKKNDNTQGTAVALKLIHATVVHAYKLKDGNYEPQGRLGCAILGSHEVSSYKLLLYKGKQNQVTIATIVPTFTFHVQWNNYANFYDEKKENWSINFDSEGIFFAFIKQIAIAKANSQGKTLTTLVIQDLVVGEGHQLDNGDTVEVKYSGWLLSKNTFGQVFDTNMNSDQLQRIRLGKSKIIKGLSEGLIGMQKGGKRLLIIPSDLAYGSEGMDSIPPNSALIYEIHVVKIKQGRESSHSPSPVKAIETTEKKPDVPPRQSFSQDDNIRMRGASISEQLTQSPKKDKAQLISRMAKMGTATLPFQGAVAAQVNSDSESETETVQPPSSPAAQSVSRTSSPKPVNKPRSRHNSGSSSIGQPVQPQPVQAAMPFHMNPQSSQVSLYSQSAMPIQQPFVCAATPYPTYQSPISGQFPIPQSPFVPGMAASVATSIADSHLPLLISETRNQNTEVRMNLAKITDKIDTVLQKVDDLQTQRRFISNANMEGSVLLQNIERIIKENYHYKEEIEMKNSKIESLNEKICDLFQRNQRFFEESSNMLEHKSESLQAASFQSQEKIFNLEQEKAKLQLELSSATIKLSTVEADLTKYQKLESELHQKLLDVEREAKRQENILNDTKEQLTENQVLVRSLQEKLKAVEQEKNQLAEKLKSMEDELGKNLESNDVIEMYKKEIKKYKEKVEHLNSTVEANVSAKLDDDKIRMELAENIRIKEKIELHADEMQRKLESAQEMNSLYEDKIKKLEVENEHLLVLKKKYEVFQEKTRAMKERYETQIVELMSEIKHLQSVKPVGTSPEFSAEIKKVMNILYKLLLGKFQSDVSYSGSEVLQTVLQTIKGLTLQILERKNQTSEDPSKSSVEPSEEKTGLESEQKDSNSEEQNQADFIQQNGISEAIPVESKSSEEMPDNTVLETANSQESHLTQQIQQESLESKESNEAPVEDSPVNNDLEITKTETASLETTSTDSRIVTEVKRESPEMWRPQPPPLFDDDDDDEEEFDWFK